MASVGPATNEMEARKAWVSAFPFEPYSNGLGVIIAATTGSATQGTLLGDDKVNSICINNMTSGWVSVQWGDSTVRATTASLAVPPGAQLLYSLTTQQAALPTTLSVISQSSLGIGNIQASLGYGGN